MKKGDLYSDSFDHDKIEEIVRQHAHLVKANAYHLVSKLPCNVQVDDLIQVGMIGLLDAIRLFDESKGASFETYANIRIRGSMIDELRRNSWLSQNALKNIRKIATAIEQIEAKKQQPASSKDIADLLGISLDEYYKMSANSYVMNFKDIDAIQESLVVEENIDNGPFNSLERSQLKLLLVTLINTLSEKEQLVLSLYYNEGLTLREIGEAIGVTEARVSQIHSESVAKLRARANRYQKG